jgi:hypothetical protein
MKDYSFLFFILYLTLVFLSKKRIDNVVKSLSGSEKDNYFEVSNGINKKYRSISISLIAMLILFLILFYKYSIYGYILFFLLCLCIQIIYLFNFLKELKAYKIRKNLIEIVFKANMLTIVGLSLFVVSIVVISV